MTRLLILLFCMVLSSTVNGDFLAKLKSFNEYSPPLSQLDEDAAELTQLIEEFWSLKPAAFLEEGPLVICRIFHECCEEKQRSQAISTFMSYAKGSSGTEFSLDKVIENCVDLTDVKVSIQSCSLIRNAIYPIESAQFTSSREEYAKLLMSFTTKLEILNNTTFPSCDDEEWVALMCLSNTTLVKSCVTKIFHQIQKDHNLRVYQKLVRETKEHLLKTNRQLVYSELKNTQKLIQPFLQVLSKYNVKKY